MTAFAEAVEAIRADDVAALRELLSAHPDLVGAPADRLGPTLLHHAAVAGSLSACDVLVAAGASLDAYDERQFRPNAPQAGDGTCTPLVSALRAGHLDVADALSARGRHPDVLWVAVALGDGVAVDSFFDGDRLLAAARDPGRRQTRQQTLDDAFAAACMTGRSELAEVMLDRGARLDGLDHWRTTGLHYAVARYPDLAGSLLDRGASIRVRDGQRVATALGWAIEEGREALVARMTEMDAIDIVDAVALGREDIVMRLLDADGALVDGPRGLGEPLREAARHGHLGIVRLLLARGATASPSGLITGPSELLALSRSPLEWALAEEHGEIAELLYGIVRFC